MLTSLTNAHAVRGRPTQNYNNEPFSARSFCELKENSMRGMKANYEAMKTSELSLKPNVMHMNTTSLVLRTEQSPCLTPRTSFAQKQQYTKNGSKVHC